MFNEIKHSIYEKIHLYFTFNLTIWFKKYYDIKPYSTKHLNMNKLSKSLVYYISCNKFCIYFDT